MSHSPVPCAKAPFCLNLDLGTGTERSRRCFRSCASFNVPAGTRVAIAHRSISMCMDRAIAGRCADTCAFASLDLPAETRSGCGRAAPPEPEDGDRARTLDVPVGTRVAIAATCAFAALDVPAGTRSGVDAPADPTSRSQVLPGSLEGSPRPAARASRCAPPAPTPPVSEDRRPSETRSDRVLGLASSTGQCEVHCGDPSTAM
jgi:hypothetical protein